MMNLSNIDNSSDCCNCQNQVYEYLCKDCKKKLCLNCYAQHEELYSSHKVLKIDIENYNKSIIYKDQKMNYEEKNNSHFNSDEEYDFDGDLSGISQVIKDLTDGDSTSLPQNLKIVDSKINQLQPQQQLPKQNSTYANTIPNNNNDASTSNNSTAPNNNNNVTNINNAKNQVNQGQQSFPNNQLVAKSHQIQQARQPVPMINELSQIPQQKQLQSLPQQQQQQQLQVSQRQPQHLQNQNQNLNKSFSYSNQPKQNGFQNGFKSNCLPQNNGLCTKGKGLQELEKENSREEQMQAISKRAKEIRNEKSRKMIKEKCEKYFTDLEQSYERFSDMQKSEMDNFQKFKKMVTSNVDLYLSGLKQQFRNLIKPIFNVREQVAQKIQQLRDFSLNPVQDFDTINPNQLFKEIEDLLAKMNQPLPKFQIKIEYLNEIREKLIHFVQILLPQYTKSQNHLQIDHKVNNQSNLAFYIPEQKQITVFNLLTQKLQNIKLDTQYQLPDMCQPIIHKENIYLMSGLIAEKSVYQPTKSIYRISNTTQQQQINLSSFTLNNNNKIQQLQVDSAASSMQSDIIVKQVEKLNDMYIEKGKCAVVAVDDYIYQFGGMQSINRLRSSTCERYSIKENVWEILPRMIRARIMSSACYVENQQKIYVFGGISDKKKVEKLIEILNLKGLFWEQIEIQNKISYIPRHGCFCVQQNPEEILIIGGMVNRKADRSQIVQIYNFKDNCIIDLGEQLPQGVCQDGRSSDIVRFKREIFILNSVVGSIYPCIQQRQKECAIMKIDTQSIQMKNLFQL